jgi:hypothetical protein
MAVQTPVAGTRFDNVNGSVREVMARFASVTANDTWATGLGTVVNAVATAGNAAAELTISGGTVTFTNTGTNYQVVARGY